MDPSKDYYGILGLDPASSTAEIRTAYKKLSLSYHPDKHKTKDGDQQEAIATKFREVAHAFNVLSNEELRSLYDKVRDYQKANPGKGLPPLDPEEAARMASGAAELRRLRRMGPKLAKHSPMMREVEIPLQQLNAGCAYPVEDVSRRRIDYTGQEFISTKTFHLIVRRGSRDGDKIIFENEGEETVDTHPGDLVFILRAKSHRNIRRRGNNDLEVFAAAIPGDVIVYATEIEGLSGTRVTAFVPSLLAALENGGTGGVWQKKYPKLGLYDSIDPWGNPPGDLYVQMRYPPFLLKDKTIASSLKPGLVSVVGSRNDLVSGSMVGGVIAASLQHQLEYKEMNLDYDDLLLKCNLNCTKVVYLLVGHHNRGNPEFWKARKTGAAMMQVIQRSIPKAQIFEEYIDMDCPLNTIEDTTWASLFEADVIILDLGLDDRQNDQEKILSEIMELFDDTGILHAIWMRHWFGCSIAAIGPACAILGSWYKTSSTEGSPITSPSIIPFYGLRSGGSRDNGWNHVCRAAEEAKLYLSKPTCGTFTVAGVLESSAYIIDPLTGNAEMIVAPKRESLINVATWDQEESQVDEADDDFGFLVAFSAF